jgi:hypothetical protein
MSRLIDYIEGRPRKYLVEFVTSESKGTLLGALHSLEKMTMPELSALIADAHDPPGLIYDEIHSFVTNLIEDWGDNEGVSGLLTLFPEDLRDRDRMDMWSRGYDNGL